MEEEFKKVLKSDELQNVSIEIVDNVLNNHVSQTVLKEIPIVKSIVSVAKIYNSISDRIFIKKAMHVLLELKNINWKDRIELTGSLTDSYSNGTEKILYAIDQLDSIEKCILFGRICKLKALDKINVDQFNRLRKVIQEAYIPDLKLILDFSGTEKKHEIHEGVYYSLINLGLLYQEPPYHEDIQVTDITMGGVGKIKNIEFYYYLTSTGKTLLQFYSEIFEI